MRGQLPNHDQATLFTRYTPVVMYNDNDSTSRCNCNVAVVVVVGVLVLVTVVTAEAQRAKIDRKSTFCHRVGELRPNFRVDVAVPHQSFLYRFYSSLVYRISLHIHMYVYRPSNCCFFSLLGPLWVLSQPCRSCSCVVSCHIFMKLFYEQIKWWC